MKPKKLFEKLTQTETKEELIAILKKERQEADAQKKKQEEDINTKNIFRY